MGAEKLAIDGGSKAVAALGPLPTKIGRAEWLERARMTIEFNKAAGIGASIVCTANEVAGMTEEQMMDSVIEGLKPTVEIIIGDSHLLSAVLFQPADGDYYI